MRNTIIFTSLVFIAVLVTSYWYFDNLGQRDGVQQPDSGLNRVTDVATPATDDDVAIGNEVPQWTFELYGAPLQAPAILDLDSIDRFILVQDAYHILHAISASGNKLWNAQLGGPILGSIQQLPDRSLVFTTEQRLYRIDTAGDPFPGFSLTLPQRATGGATTLTEDDQVRINVPVRNGLFSVDSRGSRLGNVGRRVNDQAKDIPQLPTDSLLHQAAHHIDADCRQYAHIGALKNDGQLYLLCGKDDGKLYCYLLN